ncbi:hypothetical protein EC968_008508 [Mortierella alpina]|nr:hypothetical protein EC968_008508 [Mortierella alpina]
MGLTASESLLSIHLDDPFIVLRGSSPSPASIDITSQSDVDGHNCHLNGSVIIRLSKPTKARSLSLTFTGFARTSYVFDSGKISGAKSCTAYDKSNYGCTLVEHTEILFVSESKTPRTLPSGTHRFPFSIALNESLPAVISTRSISINYQLKAALQLVSLLPFSSPHHTICPVILLQRDELPTDNLFDTGLLRISSKKSARLYSHISVPCSVLPQAGTVPLMLNLVLKGNATTVMKITTELLELVYVMDKRPPDDGAEGGDSLTEILVDERLVTRQNCPISDWPASLTDEPVMIPKRLMFKIPQLPLLSWSKPEEAVSATTLPRSGLEKGQCHATGVYPSANVRIAHTLRVVIHVRGLSDDDESKIEYDQGESDHNVWIVGNQEYNEDDTHPPSYYRSFSTTLVRGDKIHEIDQRAIEALQDDWAFILPPCYEETCSLLPSSSMSSSSSVSTLTVWPGHSHASVDQFSLGESLSESTDSHDTYADDLAAYTARYSHANPPALSVQ